MHHANKEASSAASDNDAITLGHKNNHAKIKSRREIILITFYMISSLLSQSEEVLKISIYQAVISPLRRQEMMLGSDDMHYVCSVTAGARPLKVMKNIKFILRLKRETVDNKRLQ